jgi:hypothetical protein
MKKLKPSIKISFEHDQEIWDELTYEVTAKEKINIAISELKLVIKNRRHKVQDASTKLF